MTDITTLSPNFAAGANGADLGFMPKWGQVPNFRLFLFIT